MASTIQTRYSLLQRATDLEDEKAWEEFVQQYHRFIFCVLSQLGVPQNDLEDLSQQILISLTKDLSRYDRNRAKFRAWLGAIVRNKTNSYFRKIYSTKKGMDRVQQDRSEHTEFEAPEIEDIIEKEWAAYVAGEAMTRIRGSFKGQAVEVFELGLDGYSASQIAEKTNLALASVYTLRKRVKKRLYLEIRKLASELEG